MWLSRMHSAWRFDTARLSATILGQDETAGTRTSEMEPARREISWPKTASCDQGCLPGTAHSEHYRYTYQTRAGPPVPGVCGIHTLNGLLYKNF